MHRLRAFTRAAAFSVTVLIAACRSGELVAVVTAPPVLRAGTATLSMTAAPAGVAAVRLRVTGAGVSAPLAGAGVKILLQHTVADTTVFVLSLASSAPANLLTLALSNVEAPLALVVEEATGGRNAGYAALRAADVTISIARQ